MNPGSRSGKGQRLWQHWETALQAAGVEYTCAYTNGIGHAVSLARESQASTVVAVGGDGTINEVLDGVMQSDNPELQMGVLYSGTSPDFCRFHGISIEPQRAVVALLAGQVRKVDVARIEYHDVDGKAVTAHFGCSCNIGMGASVARYANKWRRYLGDILGTGAAVIRTIATNARQDIELEIDGVHQQLHAVNHLTIAKNLYIASGLKVDVDLKPDDGKLVLIGIHGKSRLGILGMVPSFYSGSVTNAKGVILTEARSVCIRAKGTQEIEFDGDPRGYLPVQITLIPKALNLVGGQDERS